MEWYQMFRNVYFCLCISNYVLLATELVMSNSTNDFPPVALLKCIGPQQLKYICASLYVYSTENNFIKHYDGCIFMCVFRHTTHKYLTRVNWKLLTFKWQREKPHLWPLICSECHKILWRRDHFSEKHQIDRCVTYNLGESVTRKDKRVNWKKEIEKAEHETCLAAFIPLNCHLRLWSVKIFL